MNEQEIREVSAELSALLNELELKAWQKSLINIALKVLTSVIINNLKK